MELDLNLKTEIDLQTIKEIWENAHEVGFCDGRRKGCWPTTKFEESELYKELKKQFESLYKTTQADKD